MFIFAILVLVVRRSQETELSFSKFHLKQANIQSDHPHLHLPPRLHFSWHPPSGLRHSTMDLNAASIGKFGDVFFSQRIRCICSRIPSISTLGASLCPLDTSAWPPLPSITSAPPPASPVPRYVSAPSSWPISAVSALFDASGALSAFSNNIRLAIRPIYFISRTVRVACTRSRATKVYACARFAAWALAAAL